MVEDFGAEKLFSSDKTAPAGRRLNFNNFSEIKSHSSLLFNERLAILFYMLDMDSILMNEVYTKEAVVKVRARLYQIWKNIRTITRNSLPCRRALNLETKEKGVYTIDVAFDIVNRMFIYCENDKKLGFTYQRLYLMAEHLNRVELIIRDVLQYFQYFIRAEYKQLPDILQASETYKRYADKLTVDQLREVVGKRNKVDFEGLGLVNEMNDYDDVIDNDLTEDDLELADAEKVLSDGESEDGQ